MTNAQQYFMKNVRGTFELVLENGFLITGFIEKVQPLCINDPSRYQGPRVHFEVEESNVETLWSLYQYFHSETKDSHVHAD